MDSVEPVSAICVPGLAPFNCMALNYHLPACSDYDTFPQLKPFQPNAPIAMFSATSQKAVKAKFDALRASCYYQPIDLDVT